MLVAVEDVVQVVHNSGLTFCLVTVYIESYKLHKNHVMDIDLDDLSPLHTLENARIYGAI